MAGMIARGQITIVDLNDGKAVSMFLSSNKALTQIFNKENSSYVPDFTASPFLVISPEIYVSGSTTNQVAQLKGVPVWKINGSTTLADYGATAATTAPYALTIKQNMTSLTQLAIECTAIYVDPETTAETITKSMITFTKVENTGQQIRALAYAPEGNIFSNDPTKKLKAHCDLWRGSAIDADKVTYQWQRNKTGAFVDISAANAEGITGFTSNEIVIPASAIVNYEAFKCVIKDTDTASGTYNTTVMDIISFTDMSDPYMVEIIASNGEKLSSGLNSTDLKVNLWQKGAPLPDGFFTGATISWRKYAKDSTTPDPNFGGSGVEVRSGRTITVTRADVNVAARFTVQIDK